MAAYAYDDAGNSVVGELGELVITEPMPSMPVRFWGDDDGMTRTAATYFEHYPGVMRFGDWVRFTEHGTGVITGRSDATLNRGGVRIGTAEFYRVVEQLDRGRRQPRRAPRGSGGRARRADPVRPDRARTSNSTTSCATTIAAALRQALSPRHVPDVILGVSGIPRNLTGKKLEVPVKQILRGADVDTVVSRQAMADPVRSRQRPRRDRPPLMSRVAIIGTGVIGASWAALFAAHGFDVAASDPRADADVALRRDVEACWPSLVRQGLVGDGGSPDLVTVATIGRRGGRRGDVRPGERAGTSRPEARPVPRARCASPTPTW